MRGRGAFEKAGFKNAIYGKLAPSPEEDPEYSEGDIRYPLVSYKASPIPNAYGPMVFDLDPGKLHLAYCNISFGSGFVTTLVFRDVWGG